jgi:glucose-6-phosphate dehydrogenase assembly protein OpcA
METDLMATTSHPVAPEQIQNELNRIWESLETTNVARACLFNLIFYTQQNHRTAYIQRLAQKVVEKFPSRVIFVIVDKAAKEDALKTEVSILSSSKGEFDVACDYIQINAGGKSYDRVPFVVLPHILPDLPVYMVLAEDPSKDDPLSSQLEQFANRLIFDSESADNLARFASSILAHQAKSNCDIADLNWARMESSRELCSMVFHTAEKLKQIERSKKITITYNSQETHFFCHTKIQAVYLQAWLACQLGWQFVSARKDKDALLFNYKGTAGPIEILLSSAQITTQPPGLILSMDIETLDGEHYSFIRHKELLHQFTYQHSTPDICELPCQYIFTKAESGHSLVKEICRRGTSDHFSKVLNFVKNMDTQGLC